MYSIPGSLGYGLGFGAIVAPSITTGAVVATSVASSGAISGTTITGTGAVTGATLKATTDGTNAAPSINLNDRAGFFSTATPQLKSAVPLGTDGFTNSLALLSTNGTLFSGSGLLVGTTQRHIPSALQTLANDTTAITYTAFHKRLATSATRTPTQNPIIANGSAGDEMNLYLEGSFDLTLTDGNGIELSAAALTLTPGDCLPLVCNGTTWTQRAPIFVAA